MTKEEYEVIADRLYESRCELLKEEEEFEIMEDWGKRYVGVIQALEFALEQLGIAKKDFYKSKFKGEKQL